MMKIKHINIKVYNITYEITKLEWKNSIENSESNILKINKRKWKKKQ